MSTNQKLIDRVLSVPADLKWPELEKFMKIFGYKVQASKGTSHRKFYNETTQKMLNSCKPHNPDVVQRHIIRQTLQHLKDNGVL